MAKLLLLQGPGQNPALKKHYQWHVVRCPEEEDITEIWAIIHYCCQFYRTNVSVTQPRPHGSDASRSSQPWKSRTGTFMLGTSWGQGHHQRLPQTKLKCPARAQICVTLYLSQKCFFSSIFNWKPWLCFSQWGDLVPTSLSWLHPRVFPQAAPPSGVCTGALGLSLMLQTIWYRQHQSASLRQGLIINSGIFQILTHFSLNNLILLLSTTKLALLHFLQYFKSDLAASKISHV